MVIEVVLANCPHSASPTRREGGERAVEIGSQFGKTAAAHWF